MRVSLSLPLAAVAASFAFAAPALATVGCNAEGWGPDHFGDVGGCHSYYPAIENVKDQGIVQGYPDGTFKPNQPINRAEFVKILFKARYPQGTGDHCMPKKYFSDVDYLSDWFGDYVCFTNELGWIDGYPDGTFKPGDDINYAEAAKIAANAYGLDIDPDAGSEWGDQDRWFLPYSFALLARHAVPPTIDRYAHPLTRGEMAEMIYRLETGKASFDWFKTLPDGDGVMVYGVPGSDDVDFSYPGSVFAKEQGSMRIPDAYVDGGAHVVPSIRLTQVRPDEEEQGCDGMSGMLDLCRPSNSDIVIDVGVIDRPVEYLALGMDWRDEESVAPVAGRSDVRGFWEGVECEGVEYVFVPLDADRSIVVTRTFDCNERREEYLSGDEQESLFRGFLDSISVAVPAPEQSVPMMEVSIKGCVEGGGYVDVKRSVPRTTAVADATLRALAALSFGYVDNGTPCPGMFWFADHYRGLGIVDGVATVKLDASFESWRESDESGAVDDTIRAMQEAVSTNLKQFPSVQSVRYVVQP